ncbi:Demethylmenaquinone methyltransferase [Burkholderiales bacterium]|nr:MAG: methyltransferase domain-containing protein [Burkholderiales bacterium]CAG0962906.1 Demethylmenaquinone methyltransferase [Burkholderiales bacterium]
MNQGIQYDGAWSKRVEAIYATSDVAAQRDAVMRALALQPGERVLDIGCGPGYLAAAMANGVGEAGSVLGLDISEPMVALARERCSGFAKVACETANACHLPCKDADFDVVVSTQVYEYVPAVDQALRELWRVLRPGGRAVVLDTDWDSLVWHSSDPAVNARVLKAFEAHCAHPHLPATLAPRLRQLGFEVAPPEVFCILNSKLHADTYSDGIIDFIASFVRDQGPIEAPEVDAWVADLRELGKRDEYFFSLNRYLFRIGRPAASG